MKSIQAMIGASDLAIYVVLPQSSTWLGLALVFCGIMNLYLALKPEKEAM